MVNVEANNGRRVVSLASRSRNFSLIAVLLSTVWPSKSRGVASLGVTTQFCAGGWCRNQFDSFPLTGAVGRGWFGWGGWGGSVILFNPDLEKTTHIYNQDKNTVAIFVDPNSGKSGWW